MVRVRASAVAFHPPDRMHMFRLYYLSLNPLGRLCHSPSARPPIDAGTVCLWSEKDRVKREDASVHKSSSVRMLMWSPEGTRLISGDAAGVLGVWQVPVPLLFSIDACFHSSASYRCQGPVVFSD